MCCWRRRWRLVFYNGGDAADDERDNDDNDDDDGDFDDECDDGHDDGCAHVTYTERLWTSRARKWFSPSFCLSTFAPLCNVLSIDIFVRELTEISFVFLGIKKKHFCFRFKIPYD